MFYCFDCCIHFSNVWDLIYHVGDVHDVKFDRWPDGELVVHEDWNELL